MFEPYKVSAKKSEQYQFLKGSQGMIAYLDMGGRKHIERSFVIRH